MREITKEAFFKEPDKYLPSALPLCNMHTNMRRIFLEDELKEMIINTMERRAVPPQ